MFWAQRWRTDKRWIFNFFFKYIFIHLFKWHRKYNLLWGHKHSLHWQWHFYKEPDWIIKFVSGKVKKRKRKKKTICWLKKYKKQSKRKTRNVLLKNCKHVCWVKTTFYIWIVSAQFLKVLNKWAQKFLKSLEKVRPLKSDTCNELYTVKLLYCIAKVLWDIFKVNW